MKVSKGKEQSSTPKNKENKRKIKNKGGEYNVNTGNEEQRNNERFHKRKQRYFCWTGKSHHQCFHLGIPGIRTDRTGSGILVKNVEWNR